MKINEKNIRNNIHFVGIGGIGMSGIAELMLKLGYKIQGSDLSINNNIKRLRAKKINIFLNHNLPFGGVMNSGSGRYHGYAGFKEFSNQRSIIHQPKINFLSMLSAPYTKSTHRLVEFLLKIYKKL